MKNQIEVKIFIQVGKYGDGQLCVSNDMTEQSYILLGSQTVTVDVPDTNPIDAELEMLNKQVAVIDKESAAKLQVLNDRIKSLMCIEHKIDEELGQ